MSVYKAFKEASEDTHRCLSFEIVLDRRASNPARMGDNRLLRRLHQPEQWFPQFQHGHVVGVVNELDQLKRKGQQQRDHTEDERTISKSSRASTRSSTGLLSSLAISIFSFITTLSLFPMIRSSISVVRSLRLFPPRPGRLPVPSTGVAGPGVDAGETASSVWEVRYNGSEG